MITSATTGAVTAPESVCPKPAPGIRTRRRGDVYLLQDELKDVAYELNATAGHLWILFHR